MANTKPKATTQVPAQPLYNIRVFLVNGTEYWATEDNKLREFTTFQAQHFAATAAQEGWWHGTDWYPPHALQKLQTAVAQ